MDIINLNKYKESKNKQKSILDDVDLDAALSRALGIDEPENKLIERYGDNELDKLRENIKNTRIPTQKDFEKLFGDK